MNHNVSKGRWKQVKGEARKHWDKLTDDDMDIFEGKKKKLDVQPPASFGRILDPFDREYDDRRNAMGD
jgi:uncharacterized protein YjbJ (UPF0337 family)